MTSTRYNIGQGGLFCGYLNSLQAFLIPNEKNNGLKEPVLLTSFLNAPHKDNCYWSEMLDQILAETILPLVRIEVS